MSARRVLSALTVVAGAIALVAAATADTSDTPPGTRPVAPPRPAFAIVDAEGTISVVEPTGATRTFAKLEPPAGASIRARTAPGGWVFLDVDTRASGDLSFAGALVGVREGAAPVELARDVVYASTPLPLRDGRVLASRGVAGEAREHEARVDTLRVDAIDPVTGVAETVARYDGYLLFLAGVEGDEVYLYRVGVGGAEIVAVDVAGKDHAVRVISADEPPYARDFSVDPIDKRLVYVNRSGGAATSGGWATVAIGLDGKTRDELASGSFMAMIPRALPIRDDAGHAEILFTRDPAVGPELRRGGIRRLALGPGSAHVADVDEATGWIVGTVGPQGERAHVFVANVASGDVDALPAPERPTFVAGFMRGGR